jgi:DNA-nicking Smr family endonuclease
MWKNKLKKISPKPPDDVTCPKDLNSSTENLPSFIEYCAQHEIIALSQDTIIKNYGKLFNPIQPKNLNLAPLIASPSSKVTVLTQAFNPPKQSCLASAAEGLTFFNEEYEPANEFYRYGQKRLPRELRSGKFPIYASLDLHQMNKAQALKCLEQLLDRAPKKSCLLIIHGKGTNSKHNTPVLRTMVRYFLCSKPSILGYSYGSPKQGANGVTLVKLSA